MYKQVALALVALTAIGGCRSAAVETAGDLPAIAPAPATADYIPVGPQLQVSIDRTLSTATTRVGDRFVATVETPVVARNGEVAVPRGARVHGVVTGLDPSDHIGDQAAIRVAFESIEIDGKRHPLSAAVTDADPNMPRATNGDLRRDIGIGAAAGAALGAIMGGDLSDILGGAILGAASGTIISLGTGTVDAALPAGSRMTLRTTSGVTVA